MNKVLPLLLLVGIFAGCKPANLASAPPVAPKPLLVPPPRGLEFITYDGNPKKTDPNKMSFQVGWADHHEPSEFLRLREMVPNTQFQIIAFDFKTQVDPAIKLERDASELLFFNKGTGETFVVPLNHVTDSPPVF